MLNVLERCPRCGAAFALPPSTARLVDVTELVAASPTPALPLGDTIVCQSCRGVFIATGSDRSGPVDPCFN